MLRLLNALAMEKLHTSLESLSTTWHVKLLPQTPSCNSSPWTCLRSCFGTNGRWCKVSLVFISKNITGTHMGASITSIQAQNQQMMEKKEYRDMSTADPTTANVRYLLLKSNHVTLHRKFSRCFGVMFESNLNIIFMIGSTIHLCILKKRFMMQFFIIKLGVMLESGSKSALQLKRWKTLLGNMFTTHNSFLMGLLGFVHHDSYSS